MCVSDIIFMRCAPLWPVGYDSLTGQGASEYAGTMRDETAVVVLAGAVDSTREECGGSLSCYKPHSCIEIIKERLI